MTQITVTVARFDPDRDETPHPRSYTMEVRENNTILNVLLDLVADHDPSLSFRRACRSGICGDCAMLINGTPRLACETLVSEVIDGGEVDLAPLPHFKVIKDLVVDMDPFFLSLRGVVPWMVLDPKYDGKMDHAGVQRLEKSSECILCGICQADQTVEQGDPRAQLNPAAAVKAFRIGFDTRDLLGEQRAKLAEDLGLLDRPLDPDGKLGCPKNIPFAGQIIPDLKESAQRQGM